MAFIESHFYSESMHRIVPFNALVPLDQHDEADTIRSHNSTEMKTLYLLHGYSGDFTDWICGTNIQELSLRYNIAVVMPSGENSFYLDDADKGELFGEYVGNELVQFTRNLFPLSTKREDTSIGGFSMGGYGAIRTGLKYSETFSRIIALSSALIIDTVAETTPGYKNELVDYNYYKRVFGDPCKLKGSDKDPEALIASLKQKGMKIPEIFMACGTEDPLLTENRKYHDFLVSQKILHEYKESSGKHNWKFWNEYLEKAIAWIFGLSFQIENDGKSLKE